MCPQIELTHINTYHNSSAQHNKTAAAAAGAARTHLVGVCGGMPGKAGGPEGVLAVLGMAAGFTGVPTGVEGWEARMRAACSSMDALICSTSLCVCIIDNDDDV